MKKGMDYNTSMRSKTDVVRLLQIAAGLWLAYLGVSATIDYTLKSPGPVERFFYIADSGIAVFFLVILTSLQDGINPGPVC